MDEQDFRFLVLKNEQAAAENPTAYRRKVFFLVALGYGYVLVLCFALLGGLYWLVKSLLTGHFHGSYLLWSFSFASIGFAALRALWVPMGAPEGREITPDEAPGLFALVEKIRKKTGGPKTSHILLISDLNAAVCQVRRHGMFGAMTNYLLIGFPLAAALSPEQFASVLSHEYGHFAGGHSAFSAWIYRTRAVWSRFSSQLSERNDMLTAASATFVRHYFPYFDATTFALRRQNEYEADAAAARTVGIQHAADALVELSLKDRFLNTEFWPDLYRAADTHVQPPWLPYSRMASAMRAGLDRGEKAKEWLQDAVKPYTQYYDSHPSLADRLHAYALSPRIPPAIKISAAEYFFRPSYDALVAELDKTWLKSVAQGWQVRYEAAEAGRRHIAELESKSDKSPKEWVLLGKLQEDFLTSELALESYRQAVKWAPHLAEAQYLAGRILCSRGEEGGLAFLEKSIALDKSYGLYACDWAIHCLNRLKAPKETIRRWQLRLGDFEGLEEDAWTELFSMPFEEGAVPHGLGQDQLRMTLSALINDRRVRAAWLVAKKISTLPDRTYYVLFVDPVRESRDLAHNLNRQIVLPGSQWIVMLDNNELSPQDVGSFAGGPIYRRR